MGNNQSNYTQDDYDWSVYNCNQENNEEVDDGSSDGSHDDSSNDDENEEVDNESSDGSDDTNDPPDNFNWSDKDGVFWEIERQSGRLCWLNAIIDVLEARYAIKYERQIKLSKQELLDKLIEPNLDDLDFDTYTYGVSMTFLLNWIVENGVSLEADYGPYKGLLGEAKDRIPGRPVLKVSEFSRYCIFYEEDRIMEVLNICPGIGCITYLTDRLAPLYNDQTEIYSLPRDSVPANADDYTHGVVVSGYDNTGSRNAYWIRDSNQSEAPNNGHYRVTRCSGVEYGEKNAFISEIFFPEDVSLE